MKPINTYRVKNFRGVILTHRVQVLAFIKIKKGIEIVLLVRYFLYFFSLTSDAEEVATLCPH